MTKSIYTLVPDIQELLANKTGWMDEALSKDFANEVASRLLEKYGVGRPEWSAPTLRLSQMGDKCPCALWHSFHHPELAQPLPNNAELKYSYGHIIEGLLLCLAKASGHSVVGEQDELHYEGIRGHRDAVVDGCILDVKSSSSFGFKKFEDGSIATEDSFGYLAQLDGYIGASLLDPLVTVKDRGYLLVVDKQLGHIVLYEHLFTRERERFIRSRIEQYKRIVGLSSAPKCTCGTKPVGSSGNIGLDTKASYNSYKYCCFPHLRTFIYAKGPVYLTRVVRRPEDNIIEVDKFGNRVS